MAEVATYRIRAVLVQSDYSRPPRRLWIAERRLKLFCVRLWWWPLPQFDWRVSADEALCDIAEHLQAAASEQVVYLNAAGRRIEVEHG